MLPSASSSQPTTSPLSSLPPGFGKNVREESTENIQDSREDEGDEVDAEVTNEITENSSDEEVDEEDHDISRMVLTSELQELPSLILSEYFSAKVTVRSKMTILEDIQIWLTEEDKTVFRSYPHYPWGNVCYNQTLKYIKTDLLAKFNKFSSAYNLYGYPWIFQVARCSKKVARCF